MHESEYTSERERVTVKVCFGQLNEEDKSLYLEREQANERGDDSKAALIKRLLYAKGVNVNRVDRERSNK